MISRGLLQSGSVRREVLRHKDLAVRGGNDADADDVERWVHHVHIVVWAVS